MKLFEIILYCIIAVIILLFIYAIIYNKIKTQILKINSVENEIDEALRQKYDLIVKLISEIKQIDEYLGDIDDLTEIDLSSFEFERKLIEIESKIYNIQLENNKLLKNKNFVDTWHEVINLNSKIKGAEKYYNENTTIYNNLVSKFPSNIIGKIMRLKGKKYFDGKDMYDKNIKDFKI